MHACKPPVVATTCRRLKTFTTIINILRLPLSVAYPRNLIIRRNQTFANKKQLSELFIFIELEGWPARDLCHAPAEKGSSLYLLFRRYIGPSLRGVPRTRTEIGEVKLCGGPYPPRKFDLPQRSSFLFANLLSWRLVISHTFLLFVGLL